MTLYQQCRYPPGPMLTRLLHNAIAAKHVRKTSYNVLTPIRNLSILARSMDVPGIASRLSCAH